MQDIEEAAAAFLANRRVAVAACPASPRHGSNSVYKRLRGVATRSSRSARTPTRSRGIAATRILTSIPGGVQTVVIGTRPDRGRGHDAGVRRLGIEHVWMHWGAGASRRLGVRHRLRPPTRHHRDRRRLSR